MVIAQNYQNLKKIIIVFLILTYFPNLLFSQEESLVLQTEKDLLNYVDQIYGADDLLVNGRIYVPEHGLAMGHPYFEIYDWIIGTVYIKGHSYHDVKLKYDIEIDDFILFIQDNFGHKNYLVLNRHYVDSVHLERYRFINSSVIKQLTKELGYIELVYDKNFMFFIKHSKNFKKEFSETKPHGEYAEMKSVFYILKNEDLTKLPTKKSFLQYFYDSRKELKKYMKRNKIKYKKANSGELFNLLVYYDKIS